MKRIENERRDEVLKLFLNNNSMLSAYAYVLVEDWEIVQEALQEAALYMCHHWKKFTPGTNFGAWARTVTKMRCREIITREKRERLKADALRRDLEECIPSENWDRHSADAAHRKAALARCMEKLPDRYRQLLKLRYLDGHRVKVVAELVKRKSIDSVYMALSRARRWLRECVERELGEALL